MSLWTPGTQIAWRYGHPGAHDLDFVAPLTVVRDDAEVLAAWLAVGSPVLKVVRADGRDLRDGGEDAFTAPRRRLASTWSGYSVLRVLPKARPWSVWHFFHGVTGAFEGWYVNIEDPHVRWGRTTRSRDHLLDVWVEPDRSVERKDEHELEAAVRAGRYTEAEADAIRAVATEVEEVVAAWGSPFCDGWEHFVPDPRWPVPALLDEPPPADRPRP